MTKLARLISVLVLGALATACGGDPAPDLSRFVGTWTPLSGALTISCTDHSVQAIAVTDPTTIMLGTSSDLLDTDAACPVMYDVSGSVATAQPGQTCSLADVITRMHVLEDTFTTEDGVTAQHFASGMLDTYNNISVGSPVKCTFIETGSYMRTAI